MDNYINKPLSQLMVRLMNTFDIPRPVMADYLGVSVNYLNNKLHRNSFSVYDFILAAELCGCELVIKRTGDEPDISLTSYLPEYKRHGQLSKSLNNMYEEKVKELHYIKKLIDRFEEHGGDK